MKVISRAVSVLFLALGMAVAGAAQVISPAPPTQHFVCSTTGASLGGNPVAIASCGVQLTDQSKIPVALSTAYEYISNPNDSNQPRFGSGVVNGTFSLASIFPAAVKKVLVIDLTNYNLTLQGGAGVESVFQGVGLPRAKYIVGNFGIYPSYPLPGGHVQIGAGPKWLVGGRGGMVKGYAASLNYTF